jgi:hypothetical protein
MLSREERCQLAVNVRYTHYRDTSGGVVTIATVRGLEYPNVGYFGFSWCSPKDCFSKQQGRLLATKRLLKGLSLLEIQEPLLLDFVTSSIVLESMSLRTMSPLKPYERSMLALRAAYARKLTPHWLRLEY